MNIDQLILAADNLAMALRTHKSTEHASIEPSPITPEPPTPAPASGMTRNERHLANFAALMQEDPSLAYLYAHLDALGAGWFANNEGEIRRRFFGGSQLKRAQWSRDARQALSMEEFWRLLGMAQLANLA